MEVTLTQTLAITRSVIGFLGEREQRGWWQSSFFSAQSRAFLAPVFARTQLQAQCTGVTRAARLVHDERIGIGRVFHLFRLPEDMEQGIHKSLQQPVFAERLVATVASTDAALQYLRQIAGDVMVSGVGPTRVGDTHGLHDARTWQTVAAHYAHGFTTGGEVFPFFADPS